MAMTTDRDQLVGGYVTKTVKKALQDAARKEGVSVSVYIYRVLLEKLGLKA